MEYQFFGADAMTKSKQFTEDQMYFPSCKETIHSMERPVYNNPIQQHNRSKMSHDKNSDESMQSYYKDYYKAQSGSIEYNCSQPQTHIDDLSEVRCSLMRKAEILYLFYRHRNF